jgi:hypothetical protein
MTDDIDHVRIPVPPPLIFLGYLVAVLLLNRALPLSTPWTAILRVLGGLAILGGVWLVAVRHFLSW